MPLDTRVDQELENRPWHEALFSGSAWWRRGIFILAAIAVGFAALVFNLWARASVSFRAFLLDGQELFDRIKRTVVVNADQTPQYSDIRLAGHDGGDFLLVRQK